MHLPVDLLQTFVVLEKTKNFTAAGKQIHRSQPAVSMQIKRLTDIAGSPLLDTAGKRIFLTPMGELVPEHARKILKTHIFCTRIADTPRVPATGVTGWNKHTKQPYCRHIVCHAGN